MRDCPNRVDMASDFVGLDYRTLPIKDDDWWITRAHESGIYKERGRHTGIVFGKGGDILIRAYDKTHEIKDDPAKQTIMAEAWGVSKYDDLPVTRMECQLRKDALKEFQIYSLKDLEEKLASLWQYCTTKWLRLCTRPVNRNNSEKEKLHPWWEHVQAIEWPGFPIFKRVKEIAQKSVNHIVKQVAGCAKTIAAVFRVPVGDLESMLGYLWTLVDVELNSQHAKNPFKFDDQYQVRLAECWGAL